jgi:phosphopantothenoylcysteine decarboxylase/phosphopantothenate--cysteine ligase
MAQNPTVLLIISGSIAAYKSLELIRRLREQSIDVRTIITKGGLEFVTPLSVASLSGSPAYTDLFSLKDEAEMGHIRLSREADVVVVAPASADLIAKMAHGTTDDLATATLLASNKPLLVAPAMNTQMWNHKATQRNLKQIVADGAKLIAPSSGTLACGEVGAGRLAEPDDILKAILASLGKKKADKPAFRALVTSGPTFEPLDPVRFIGNRSSGKQGHAIAAALAARGAEVTLVAGPTALAAPAGVKLVSVTTAAEMLAACQRALPADVAVFAAAVSDWRAEKTATQKIKKTGKPPTLSLTENPDILATISKSKQRPKLVIGFAAETSNLLKNSKEKLARKKCDWIIANDVSNGAGFDADENTVSLVSARGVQNWPKASKQQIAETLAETIENHLKGAKK